VTSALAGPLRIETGWPLWRRQVWAVSRLETRRTFSIGRSLWLLWLAFAPVLIIGVHAFHDRQHYMRDETLILAVIVQVFYVRFAIFFGCLALALRLFRGEVAEKTLHYPVLAPIRRDVLVVGKFLSAALTAILLYGAGITLCFGLMYGHMPGGPEFVTRGPGLAHLGAYLLATVLACLGYLAVVLAISLVFKNPIVPAVMVVVWEGLNGILPVWLKRFSVTFYVKPIYPVELPIGGISGLFTVVAEPTPVWICVTGLLAFSGLALAFVCWRVRRLEVGYATD
jgi:hypothetical protein